MNTRVSHPDQASLDKLATMSIPRAIIRKYDSPEDRADAFDGAFSGLQIYNHLSQGADKKRWLDAMLGWYESGGQQNFSSPFYSGLRLSLSRLGFRDFYDEAIKYVKQWKV